MTVWVKSRCSVDRVPPTQGRRLDSVNTVIPVFTTRCILSQFPLLHPLPLLSSHLLTVYRPPTSGRLWGQCGDQHCCGVVTRWGPYFNSIVVLEESPPRRSSRINFQVLVFVDPWTTKSSKIVKDFAFCKQSIMYDDHVVTAIVHEVRTVKNGLLILISKLLRSILCQ